MKDEQHRGAGSGGTHSCTGSDRHRCLEFLCVGCGKWRGFCQGAADGTPELCDFCAEEVSEWRTWALLRELPDDSCVPSEVVKSLVLDPQDLTDYCERLEESRIRTLSRGTFGGPVNAPPRPSRATSGS